MLADCFGHFFFNKRENFSDFLSQFAFQHTKTLDKEFILKGKSIFFLLKQTPFVREINIVLTDLPSLNSL